MNILKFMRNKLLGFAIIGVLLLNPFLVPSMILVQPVNASSGDWWNVNWSYRKAITINSAQVSGVLSNFPVLVDVNGTDLAGKSQADGDDIVFTDANSTKLNHEIEFYDGATGHLVAWVNIPQLSSSSNTVLYMYYGNSLAGNQQNPAATWDSNYVMVQHLEENSGLRNDSTGNGNNGTPQGGVVRSVGKIDSANDFDGISGRIRFPYSSSLATPDALTLEAWVYRKTSNAFHTVLGSGWSYPWLLRIEGDNNAIMFRLRFIDGTRTPELEPGTIGKGNWYYVVATFDKNTGEVRLYVNGNSLNTWQSADYKKQLLVDPTKTFFIGCTDNGQNYFNGTIDEVRVSNTARSSNWVRTNYNNQKDSITFYTVGSEENYSQQSPPTILDEEPRNGAVEVYTNPTLSIRAIDYDNDPINITFSTNATGIWRNIVTFTNVRNGRYIHTTSQMNELGTKYYWMVGAFDGKGWTNKTYSFTTTTKILTLKWTKGGLGYGVSGVLIADIDKDGLEEVIEAGSGKVSALRGSDGSVMWTHSDAGIGWWVQPQMADLNLDGSFEIIVPLMYASGILTLYANNGNTYWRTTGLGGATFTSSPVVADIDGDGYPTIFAGTEDTEHGLNGTGRVTALSYDGRILYQTFAWRPCSGGLSIADTDNDGEFELYMGDRHMYMEDGDYGKGIRSFWAKNLTERWSHPDILSSSNIPILADVNKDGILDVVAAHIAYGDAIGGFAVLNSADGSAIKKSLNLGMPVHKKPTVYDIDGDRNLEILVADYEFGISDDIVIWDLVQWKEDKRLYIGKNVYPPQIADVTGDGIMDIIASNFTSIFVFSTPNSVYGDYRNIYQVTVPAGTEKLNYAVVQDIDGDGYNEVVVQGQSGTVYAYDTPARRPNPRARSEVQYYSERRLGVAEYVPPPGRPSPLVVAPNPLNNSEGISVSLSQLSFNLVDYQGNLMNYSVTTFPNIGSSSGTNVPNRRFSIPIENLEYSTTYTWKVSVTDGAHWTNVTYTFTTATFANWWNTNWQYRKTITIDRTKVAATLSNFPVLINVTDSDLSSKAQGDGDDIVFVDVNGAKLNHEIEFYDGATGHLVAWVNVPYLSSTSNTILYMYYGNNATESQQTPSVTWDPNYMMVQHLEEESSAVRFDSTSNRNNGTAYGGIVKTNGKMGDADRFDGLDDRVSVPDKDSLDLTNTLTFEAWIFPTSWGENGYGRILDKNSAQGYVFYIRDTTDLAVALGGTIYASLRNSLTLNNWQYVVVTFDRSLSSGQIKFFVNGVLRGTATRTTPIPVNTASLYIGNNAALDRTFNGAIDEIRISNTARSANWILTSYNNQKDPTSFYIIGTKEWLPNTPIIASPSPPNKATNVPLSLTELSFNITDYQNEPMNYTVTTNPNIGSDSRINVSNGRCSIPVSTPIRSMTYTWKIAVTDGTYWANATLTFTTYSGESPIHEKPILISSKGTNKTDEKLIAYNQTTLDSEGDKITNIYNWYKNNISITNLLLPFDTKSSTTIKDYSGYGNNGNIVRDVTWISNGRVGGAYKFDRGYMRVLGTSLLDGGGQWTEITVELWVYLTENQKDSRIIAKIPSYEIGFLSAGTNIIYAGIWTDAYYNVVSYPALRNNTWYHIAFTYTSGGNLTLYVNGKPRATRLVSGNIRTSGSEPLYIGWFDYFKGIVDEVRIYPKSLSPQQIYQRYLETKDGLTNSSIIVPEETTVGDIWKCQVTPNDSYQDGASKFSNTITIVLNNPPTITSYFPSYDPTILEGQSQEFNVTYFDPDGDPLTVKWYVNGSMVEPSPGDSYTYQADVAGTYIITVIASDGLAQASHQWALIVKQP